MGIDIYAHWKGQTEQERDEQHEVWTSAAAGHCGYLREAYHGEPYATQHLMPEAFENESRARIPAATLRERLPETLRLAEIRQRQIYDATTPEEIQPVLDSYTAFVELCERMERKTGQPVEIAASW